MTTSAIIDEHYNSERLTKILTELVDMIGAKVLNISTQDFEPQVASVTVLIAEDELVQVETPSWLISTRAMWRCTPIRNTTPTQVWLRFESTLMWPLVVRLPRCQHSIF